MSCHCVAQPRDEPSAASYRTVAVVGPPNSGKTTLFNRLTKLRQKVGNFPGVTVEHHTGYIRDANGEEVALIDLPGVYSLTPKSEDEKVAIDVLTGKMPGTPRPDAIILVLNSTNLHTHLVLAARVIALGIPTLVLLNMADELRKQEGHVDVLSLARELGTPVALVSATTGEGMIAVQNFLSSATAGPEPLELPVVGSTRGYREWAVRVGNNAEVSPACRSGLDARLDAIFLHRIWGPVDFRAGRDWRLPDDFCLGPAALQLAAEISRYHRSAIRQSSAARDVPVAARQWRVEGTGSVLVFLPQILLLFLVIGILEDSGYLSRAAVIADRTMSRVGLTARASFRCYQPMPARCPAIMATRTIESKRDRMATILIAPFMTCSARLPVYTMVIAAFLPNRPLLGVFLGTRAPGDAWAVCARVPDGGADGAPAEVHHPEEQGRALHSGDAAVSLADALLAGLAPGRSRQGFPVSRRHRDHAGFAAAVGGDQLPHAPRAAAGGAGQRSGKSGTLRSSRSSGLWALTGKSASA